MEEEESYRRSIELEPKFPAPGALSTRISLSAVSVSAPAAASAASSALAATNLDVQAGNSRCSSSAGHCNALRPPGSPAVLLQRVASDAAQPMKPRGSVGMLNELTSASHPPQPPTRQQSHTGLAGLSPTHLHSGSRPRPNTAPNGPLKS